MKNYLRAFRSVSAYNHQILEGKLLPPALKGARWRLNGHYGTFWTALAIGKRQRAPFRAGGEDFPFKESRVIDNRDWQFVQIFILLLGFSTSVWATPGSYLAAPTDLTVAVSSATICSGTSATLTASGCPATATLRWSTSQTGSVIAVSPKQTTSYSVACEVVSTTATSSTATSTTVVTTVASATATVQVYRPIVIALETTAPTCNNGNDGRIVVRSSGGVGEFKYQIFSQPLQTLNEFNGLKAGTYPVTVQDDMGCTTQASAQLTQPSAISAAVTVINTKCVGGGDGALIVSASGGNGDYRYALANVTAQQTSGTFINLVANTTYTLIVSDKTGCVLYQPVTIGQAAPFTITLTPASTRCIGSSDGSITVSASGGSGAYQYQLGSGPFQTGTQFTGLATASYTITVQDANGCQGKQSVSVGQPAALTLTALSKPVTCAGLNTGVITVTAAGGTGTVSYQTANQAMQTSTVFSGVAAGNYTVVGTDANGCTGLTSVTVGNTTPLKIQASTVPASCCTCPTGAVKLTSTGGTGTGLQYQIIGRAYQANSQIDKLPPNTYRLRVTDDGGCTDSTVATVIDSNPLSLTTGTLKNVTCAGGNDGSATMQVTGGTTPFIYYWQTERRDTLASRAATQTNLTEGTYTVSVRDANQCTAATIFVTLKAQNPVPTSPTISQVGSSTLVANQTTGLQWYIRSGTSAATSISGATGSSLVPYASGQYYVVVTVNGCASAPSNLINFVLTAVSEPINSLAVRVVPNPVVDRLRLAIEQPERSTIHVHLLDASGRAVRSYQLPAFVGKQQVEWPMEGVSSGTYLLSVSSDSRQSILRVVVE